MIFVDKYKSGNIREGTTDSWRITRFMPRSSVTGSDVRLLGKGNRFPGDLILRRHESGGIELRFTGLRTNSKDRLIAVIPKQAVDSFIVILLLLRTPQENDDTLITRDDLTQPFSLHKQRED
jgi:hypothetical protein